MSDEPKSFTVKDRRHFTQDGRSREEPEAQDAPKDAPPEATPGPPAEPGPPPAGPVNFAQFLMSLGTQAGLLLSGQIESQSAAESLAEARHIIAILEMLKEKTEGRRTPDEERLLDDLLYQLRMGYVARAREGGA
jgi:hypothetical protein